MLSSRVAFISLSLHIRTMASYFQSAKDYASGLVQSGSDMYNKFKDQTLNYVNDKGEVVTGYINSGKSCMSSSAWRAPTRLRSHRA